MNNFYKDAKEFAIANIEPYAKETDNNGEFPKVIFEKIKNVTLYRFIADLNYQEHNQKNSLHEENTQINI